MSWKEVAPTRVTGLSEARSLLRTPQCRLFASRYQQLLEQAGGAIPRKDGLDLSVLAPLLPDLALVMIVRPDQCIIRLAGERLKQRLGYNPVGQNYLDLVADWRRASAMRAICAVIDGPSGFRAEVRYRYSDGAVRETETLALPLAAARRDDNGFVLLIDRALSDEDLMGAPVGPVCEAMLRRRHMIDLGYGLDQALVDRLPLEEKRPSSAVNW